MPSLRAQKEDLVVRLTEELQNSRVALVFAYSGLDMKSNDTLRTKSFEAGAKIKMISNNLLGLILKNINRELTIPEKTLALAYGFTDEVEAAKTLVVFAKETERLEVLGGWIDGNFFDASQIKTLSSLPNKETLQAQLVGRLSGLIGGLAYAINFPMQKLAYVMEAVKNAQPAVEVSRDEPKLEEKTEVPAPAESQSTDETKVESLAEDSAEDGESVAEAEAKLESSSEASAKLEEAKDDS